MSALVLWRDYCLPMHISAKSLPSPLNQLQFSTLWQRGCVMAGLVRTFGIYLLLASLVLSTFLKPRVRQATNRIPRSNSGDSLLTLPSSLSIDSEDLANANDSFYNPAVFSNPTAKTNYSNADWTFSSNVTAVNNASHFSAASPLLAPRVSCNNILYGTPNADSCSNAISNLPLGARSVSVGRRAQGRFGILTPWVVMSRGLISLP